MVLEVLNLEEKTTASLFATTNNPDVSLSLSPVGEFGWDGAANSFSLIDTKNRVAVMFGAHVRGYEYGYNCIHPTLRNIVYECLEV